MVLKAAKDNFTPTPFIDLIYLGEVVPIEKNKVVAFHYVLKMNQGRK